MRVLSLILTLTATPLWAAPPRVMTDIAPVQSLTDMVLGDLGTAGVLLPPGASPHQFAMRPGDAAALASADVVIWVGPGLSHWLADPLATLAPDAMTLVLLETSGWAALPARDDPSFTDDDDHDTDTGGPDPHAWMDPDIAAVWLGHIAATLAMADPDNAATYAENATVAASNLRALGADIATQLAPLSDRRFILPHDGYQYLEQRFGLSAAGAVTLSDATAPGPAHIAALRDLVTAGDVVCILTDPETGAKWVDLLAENATGTKTARIDGKGGSFAPGSGNYPAMLRQMADALADCLS